MPTRPEAFGSRTGDSRAIIKKRAGNCDKNVVKLKSETQLAVAGGDRFSFLSRHLRGGKQTKPVL
jgi:hypothetical protein